MEKKETLKFTCRKGRNRTAWDNGLAGLVMVKLVWPLDTPRLRQF